MWGIVLIGNGRKFGRKFLRLHLRPFSIHNDPLKKSVAEKDLLDAGIDPDIYYR